MIGAPSAQSPPRRTLPGRFRPFRSIVVQGEDRGAGDDRPLQPTRGSAHDGHHRRRTRRDPAAPRGALPRPRTPARKRAASTNRPPWFRHPDARPAPRQGRGEGRGGSPARRQCGGCPALRPDERSQHQASVLPTRRRLGTPRAPEEERECPILQEVRSSIADATRPRDTPAAEAEATRDDVCPPTNEATAAAVSESPPQPPRRARLRPRLRPTNAGRLSLGPGDCSRSKASRSNRPPRSGDGGPPPGPDA